jgi:conjugative relaxase-like TrwC/TraI family protein
VADLARYYTHGADTPEQREMAQLATEVAEGRLTYSEALDELMLADLRRGGDGSIEREAVLGTRLADATSAIIDDRPPPAAELRRDMHPLVAKGLGVDPEAPLTVDQINGLLAGRRADGEEIEGKRYTPERTITDKRTGETKELVPIGSYDFTLTPDKSVSVAWAFAEAAEQAAIYQAHRDAAHEAMAQLEGIIGRARLGDGGKDGAEPGHIGWLAFDHHTARPTLMMAEGGETVRMAVPVPGDPDLHTHFLVPNAVFCEGGRVGALDSAQLHGAVKEIGALYQAHLAQQLRDRLGAAVSLDPDTGMARLDAIPAEVRDHFSKRTQGGEEAARAYAKEQGLDWDALTPERRAGLLKAGTQGQVPGLDGSLREKLKKDDLADFADWQRQAKQLGWEYRGIETYGPPAPPLSPEQRLQAAYETALPWLERELEQRAVIGMGDARAAATRGLIAHGIAGSADVDAVVGHFMAQGVRQHGQVTGLYWQDTDDPRQAKITTALHARQERDFIRLAKVAASDRRDALTRSEVRRAMGETGKRYSGEQARAIHQLGEGGRLGVLIGVAGAGKNVSLQPLVNAWQGQGRDVHGIALAWRQADELVEAGIPKHRVKALSVFEQAGAKGDLTLSAKSVVVVDELGLLGTRQGLELLRLQERHGFRMVWMGDPKQLASIEAGPIIELSRQALGEKHIPQILTTQRQQSAREREIASLFRDGQAAAALTMKRQDGTAELVPGGYREALERTAQLVKERLQAHAGNPSYRLGVSAPTNADAHRLGVAIREARRELGQVGPDQVRLKATGTEGLHYEMALAKGDKVRLFASTRAEGQRGSIGRNGSVLTVLEADADGMRVRNAKGTEGKVAWKSLADAAGRVRLAYGEVMTTHTAQGSTSTEHIYALPAGSKAVTGFSAYSAGTRHRQASFLVISEGAEKAEVARQRPLNDVRPIAAKDAWANVAANFSRQPDKLLAIDFLAKAGAVRRGAARQLQDGMRRIEAKTETTLHQTLARRREERELAPVVAELGKAVGRQRQVMERIRELGPAVAQAVRQKIGQMRGLVPERGQGPRIGI